MMALSVNTNVSALAAQLNLNRSSDRLSISLERLSTGLKINRSVDDAAGLVLSEYQRSQISGLTQAITNIDRAVTFAQTAESALGEINSLLIELRELAVASGSTGTLSAAALQANQDEVGNLLDSIDRVANTSKFGRLTLLDGSQGVNGISNNSTVEYLAATDETVFPTVGDTSPFTVSITRAATQASVVASTVQSDPAGLAASETLTVNGINITLDAGLNQAEVIHQINEYSGQTGVTAKASPTGALTLTSLQYGEVSNFKVVSNLAAATNTTGIGQTALDSSVLIVEAQVAQTGNLAGPENLVITTNLDSTTPTVTTIAFAGGENQAAAIALINAQTPTTGVTADALGSGGRTRLTSSSQFTVDSDVTPAGTSSGFEETVMDTRDISILSPATIAAAIPAGGETLTITKTGTGVTTDITIVAGRTSAQARDDINLYTTQTGVTADLFVRGANTYLRLSAIRGGDFTVVSTIANGTGFDTTTRPAATPDRVTAGNGQDVAGTINSGAAGASTATGNANVLTGDVGQDGSGISLQVDGAPVDSTVTLTNQSPQFHIGAFSNETTRVSLDKATSAALGLGAGAGDIFPNLRSIDVRSEEGAEDAIAVIDRAVEEIATMRGVVGAFQSQTLQVTQSNLRSQLVNLNNAESVLRDTDFTTEITNFTNEQIRQQAATTVLGLANQQAQAVLALLAG